MDPLEGITLENILKALVAHYGWQKMGETVTINCFISDPSISSSLKFLRRTPWARKKVENLYLCYLHETGSATAKGSRPAQRADTRAATPL